jgi:hypothetical protein
MSADIGSRVSAWSASADALRPTEFRIGGFQGSPEDHLGAWSGLAISAGRENTAWMDRASAGSTAQDRSSIVGSKNGASANASVNHHASRFECRERNCR